MKDFLALEPIKSVGEYAFDALVEMIRRFQGGLSDEMEVGIVANGGGAIIHVERLQFSGQMIVLDGVDTENRKSRLIQHYTQTNVQLIAVNKLEAQAKRIGF